MALQHQRVNPANHRQTGNQINRYQTGNPVRQIQITVVEVAMEAVAAIQVTAVAAAIAMVEEVPAEVVVVAAGAAAEAAGAVVEEGKPFSASLFNRDIRNTHISQANILPVSFHENTHVISGIHNQVIIVYNFVVTNFNYLVS